MKLTNSNFKLRFAPLLLMLLVCITANAQRIQISGIVKEASNGDPIIGANVMEVGTTNGTMTNIEGRFTLSVNADAQIEIKFLGFQPQRLSVAGQTSFNIMLEEDAFLLKEVVAIGYGTVKKEDATGSLAAIKPDEMNKGLQTTAQDMLAGKIAGVSVISDGGTPGGSSKMRIRGGSSLSASNDPLIVIDGLPMDNNGVKGLANPLSMVNPNDIETFTVLKDASATAIYGSRASNGVIIITTKKGKKDTKPSISYSGNLSLNQVRRTMDVLDGDAFRTYANQLYSGEPDIMSKLGSANTDWQSQIYRTGVSTDHNVTVTGGLKNVPYRASFGYTNQNGIVKTSNFERYTLSAGLNPSFFDDYLQFNVNAKYMFAKNRYADGGAIGAAVFMDPSQPVMADGDIYQKYFGGYYQWDIDATSLGDPTWTRTRNALATFNPLATLMLRNDRARSNSFIGNVDADYKFHFLPQLKFHAALGGDRSGGNQTTDVDRQSAQNNYYGSYNYALENKYNIAFNSYLQYSNSFGAHIFDAMAGYEWQHFYRDGNSFGFGTTLSTNTTNPDAKVNESKSVFATESYLVSFFGRLNYTAFDRYLLTGTLRRDGSSRFAKENRWGLFPSLAFAWKINNESFLSSVNAISDLKLRLGYGITGQQEINQGDYPYMPIYTINVNGAYYSFGGTYYDLYRPNAYNTKLKWEETTTYNIGLDYGFLNNRITGSVEYYKRITNDLLNMVKTPAGTNFNTEVISNIGSLENNGFEFGISAKPISKKDLVWSVDFNLATNTNKITKLTAAYSDDYLVGIGNVNIGTGTNIQAHKVGYAANSFYVFQQVYDDNGNPIENVFVDRNGDGIINTSDKYIYKKPAADVLLGMASKLMYKEWDFSFTLRASLGNYVYNQALASMANVGYSGIYSTSGFFTNRTVDAINLGFNGTGDYYMSDYFVQNASFLRCDNITIGYSFADLFGSKINGRVYGTAQNLFVITKYKGLDPEISGGIDNNFYPRPMVGVLGVTLNF